MVFLMGDFLVYFLSVNHSIFIKQYHFYIAVKNIIIIITAPHNIPIRKRKKSLTLLYFMNCPQRSSSEASNSNFSLICLLIFNFYALCPSSRTIIYYCYYPIYDCNPKINTVIKPSSITASYQTVYYIINSVFRRGYSSNTIPSTRIGGIIHIIKNVVRSA